MDSAIQAAVLVFGGDALIFLTFILFFKGKESQWICENEDEQ